MDDIKEAWAVQLRDVLEEWHNYATSDVWDLVEAEYYECVREYPKQSWRLIHHTPTIISTAENGAILKSGDRRPIT